MGRGQGYLKSAGHSGLWWLLREADLSRENYIAGFRAASGCEAHQRDQLGLDWVYKDLSGYHAVGNMRPGRYLSCSVGQEVAVASKKKQERASPGN